MSKHDEAHIARVEKSIVSAGKTLEFVRVENAEHGYKVYWLDAKPNEECQSAMKPTRRDVTDLVEFITQMTKRTVMMAVKALEGEGDGK